MLAANPDFQIRLHTASTLRAHADELTDTISIEHLKRIVSHDLSFDVVWEKAARVVATQPKRRLCKVVRAKREKLRVLRNPIRHQRRARQLDHGPDHVLDRHAMLAHHLSCDLVNQFRLLPQFFTQRHERHHDLEFDFLALALHLARSFEHRATLHPRHFRKQQSQDDNHGNRASD